MWRAIKFIFLVAVVTLAVLALTGHKIGGKTVPEYIKGMATRPDSGETIKDIRRMLGEAIKAVGDELSDDVTTEESAQLKEKIKQDLEKRSHFYDAKGEKGVEEKKKF